MLVKCSLIIVLSLLLSFELMTKGWAASSVTARENLDILIKTKSCKNCDLSGLNLTRMDLSGADLEGADLSQSKLQLVNLQQANLKNANLSGALFGGADLGDADLRGADLRGAHLDGAYMLGALLDGKFVTANPYKKVGVSDIEKKVYVDDPATSKKNPEKNAIKVAQPRYFSESPPPPVINTIEMTQDGDPQISEKDIIAIPEDDKQELPQPAKAKTLSAISPVVVDIEKKTVAKAEISSIEAQEKVKNTGEISEIPVAKNEMVAAHEVASELVSKPLQTMPTVDLTSLLDEGKNQNLEKLFRKNRCYGCDLSGLDLSGKNLKKADLEKANLSYCNLEGANLEGANLKGSNLTGANLKRVRLKKADLYRADLSEADLTDADVSGAMFDDAVTENAHGFVQPSNLTKP